MLIDQTDHKLCSHRLCLAYLMEYFCGLVNVSSQLTQFVKNNQSVEGNRHLTCLELATVREELITQLSLHKQSLC